MNVQNANCDITCEKVEKSPRKQRGTRTKFITETIIRKTLSRGAINSQLMNLLLYSFKKMTRIGDNVITDLTDICESGRQRKTPERPA